MQRSGSGGICRAVRTEHPQVVDARGVDDNFVIRRSGLRRALLPDTPNRPEWPSAVLRPGETYANHLEWRFATTS